MPETQAESVVKFQEVSLGAGLSFIVDDERFIDYDSLHPEGKPPYLITRFQSGRYLFENLVDSNAKALPSGLVLICGETGCGKTQLLNSLLYQLTQHLIANPKGNKKPHILVVGDPIETWILNKPDPSDNGKFKALGSQETGAFLRNDSNALNLNVRFTARNIGLDVASVEDATMDALRETPSVMIISELRKDADFQHALKFAGTGHLVLATAHASSLIDMMIKLSRVEQADSSYLRASLASRLVGIVNVRSEQVFVPVTEENVRVNASFMRVWRNKSAGMRSFIADGPAALLVPGSPNKKEQGVLSYKTCAQWFEEQIKTAPSALSKCEMFNKVWKQVKLRADALDLRIG